MRSTVALIGEWPQDTDEEFKEEFLKYEDAVILKADNALRSTLIPDGFERLREIRYAHELSLARVSDIAVFGNNGVLGSIKKMHIKKLYEETVLVVWTPPSIDDDIPLQENMIPGIVQVQGNIELLAKICTYICAKPSI